MVIVTSILLLATTAALYSSRFLAVSLPWPIRTGLTALRGAWFVFLVWLSLADPRLVRQENILLDPLVPVVIDDSESMALPAVLGQVDSSKETQTKWQVVRHILEENTLPAELQRRGIESRMLRLSQLTGPQSENPSRQLLPDSPRLPYTNLRTAIERLTGQFPTNRCPGFIFLTDGQWNAGGDPLKASLVGESTPAFSIFAIGIGDTHPPTDIRLVSISSPPTLRSGRMGTATIHGDSDSVKNAFDCPLQIELAAESGDVIWTTQTIVRIQPGTARWRERTTFPALEPGRFKLRATISAGPADINPENNNVEADIQILEDQDRVLMLTGGPDWDFKLIKRALEEDPLVSVLAFWLRPQGALELGDRRWISERRQGETEPAGGGPAEPPEDPKQDLDRWSIVMLHGVPLGGPRSAFRDRVSSYVEDGGTVIILPGGEGRKPEVYWPCDPSASQLIVLEEDTTVVAAQAESRSLLAGPLLAVLGGPVPPLARVFRLVPPLKGAQVVLACESRRLGGRLPVVTELRLGLGRVVHIYCDTFWRWRMFAPGQGADPFGRFWRAFIHLLSPVSVPKIGRLVVSDPSPRIGDLVDISLELEPESQLPQRPYHVTVQGPDGSVVLPLDPDPILPSRWSAKFVPSATGSYIVREDQLGYEARMNVTPFDEETARPAQNVDFLKTLARSTGGIYRDSRYWREVIERIPVNPTTIQRDRERFWASRPWVLACLIAMLAAEWYTRQRQGLP